MTLLCKRRSTTRLNTFWHRVLCSQSNAVERLWLQFCFYCFQKLPQQFHLLIRTNWRQPGRVHDARCSCTRLLLLWFVHFKMDSSRRQHWQCRRRRRCLICAKRRQAVSVMCAMCVSSVGIISIAKLILFFRSRPTAYNFRFWWMRTKSQANSSFE